MALDIKPTRSELINLKRRIKQTQNGYNLLKMKRDGLFHEFRTLLSEMIEAREGLVGTYREAVQSISLASAIEGGLAVKSAVVAKTRAEGVGDHDLILKHMGTGPSYCTGFISTEVKVSAIGKNGRKFTAAWQNEQERSEAALKKVLRANEMPFGAAMLVLIGVADEEELLMTQPPLFVKAQLYSITAGGEAKWGQVLLDRSTHVSLKGGLVVSMYFALR